jgi:hypothetical protein
MAGDYIVHFELIHDIYGEKLLCLLSVVDSNYPIIEEDMQLGAA